MSFTSFSWAPLAGRILIGGMFLMAGVQKLMNVSGTAGYIESVGLPLPMLGAVIAIVVEIVGGLTILSGFKIRIGALLLAFFTLIVTFIFHADFADQAQVTLFTKNMAIVGGLLYMAHFGAGPFSYKKHKAPSPTPEVV